MGEGHAHGFFIIRAASNRIPTRIKYTLLNKVGKLLITSLTKLERNNYTPLYVISTRLFNISSSAFLPILLEISVEKFSIAKMNSS